jgi:nucleoid-associated protein YgaU
MTSDAKIGLLLGLVFIFVIAFIINGLPNFFNKTDNNELTTTMTTFEDNSLGIGAKERKTQKDLDWMKVVEKQTFSEDQILSENEQDIRSVIPIPVPSGSSTSQNLNESTKIESQVAQAFPSAAGAQKAVVSSQPAKPNWPKIYVVREGDNLAGIAKRFYGPVEGNRKININRIFEANRKQLRTPDEIYVGQKLIIPPLSNATQDKNKIDNVLSGNLFEKVKSIGRSVLADSGDSSGTNKDRWYVVRQGDSLWTIAAAQLGNGSRFSEISKLNTDNLNNENILVIGMRLRMPAR